jgi:hypothetical protein
VHAVRPGAAAAGPVQHLEPELPVRFETVVNAVEAFAAWMRSREKAERM